MAIVLNTFIFCTILGLPYDDTNFCFSYCENILSWSLIVEKIFFFEIVYIAKNQNI